LAITVANSCVNDASRASASAGNGLPIVEPAATMPTQAAVDDDRRPDHRADTGLVDGGTDRSRCIVIALDPS
jgi:hypothetical protein